MKVSPSGQANGDPVNRLAACGVTRDNGLPSKLAVTASRNGDGNLAVVVWAVSNGGTPSVAASRIEGSVSEVGVHDVGEFRFVVAMRDNEGRLRLIAYTVSENGKTLTRRGTMVGEPVRDFAITSSSDTSVTVARRQNDRRVVVSTWKLDANGMFGTESSVPLGDGKVTALDVTGANQEFCFTAATDTGTHRLRAFKGPDTLGGAATGSKVRSVAIGVTSAPEGYWTACIEKDNASVRTGLNGITGRLILDTGMFDVTLWEFESGTLMSPLVRIATCRLEGMAGIAWELRVLISNENLCYVLARGADTYEAVLPRNQGKPKMRLFAFERQGDKIVRVGQGNATGRHSLIALAPLQFTGPSTTHSMRLFTAARDGNGKLKVTVWDVTD